jgi:hypothetical protein
MNPTARLAIGVEDVLAYLELAKEQLCGDKSSSGNESTSLGKLPEATFMRLADSVHPLALGNVKRSVNQIRQLARKLLDLHPPELDEAAVTALVSRLTTEFYSHQHQISRREAIAMGLPITVPSNTLEGLLLAYYDEIVTDLELLTPFDAARILRTAFPPAAPVVMPAPLPAAQPQTALSSPSSVQPTPMLTVQLERGYIETSQTCDAFTSRGEISYQSVMGQPLQIPGGQQIMLPSAQQAVRFEVVSELWERLA